MGTGPAPTLVLSQHDRRVVGVLCGARTPKLLEQIERASNGSALERASQPDCPDIVRTHAPDEQILTELAQRAGILCQIDAPTALLSHLPSVDSMIGLRREPLPAAGREWDVRHFVIKGKIMKWNTITLHEANAPDAQGLFCFTRFQTPQYFLRDSRETMRPISGGGAAATNLSLFRPGVFERQAYFKVIFFAIKLSS